MESPSKRDAEHEGLSDTQREILTGGQTDTTRGSMGGPSRTFGLVGGRGETGGASNADMGGTTGITTTGTAGGMTAAATPGDLGISEDGLTGDLGATTAGPEGDFGDPEARQAAAVSGGASLGDVGNTFQSNYASVIADRRATTGYRAEEPSGAAPGEDVGTARISSGAQVSPGSRAESAPGSPGATSDRENTRDADDMDKMDPETRHVIEGDSLMDEIWEVTNAGLGGERIAPERR